MDLEPEAVAEPETPTSAPTSEPTATTPLPGEGAGPAIPTMADLDSLAAELDEVDRTLAELDAG